MRVTERPAESWVVYQTTFGQKSGPMSVVCEQSEWEALERSNSGSRTLLKSGIPTEGEAERFARGVPGGPALGAGKSLARP
jgi:hypothetical protein